MKDMEKNYDHRLCEEGKEEFWNRITILRR